MPEHKFVYRVTGMALSDAQKTRISEEIAVAVARVIATEFPNSPHMDYESPHPICGGSHLIAQQSGDRPQTPDDPQPLVERPTRDQAVSSDSQDDALPHCKL